MQTTYADVEAEECDGWMASCHINCSVDLLVKESTALFVNTVFVMLRDTPRPLLLESREPNLKVKMS